jgi:hypothetical protein
MVQPTPDEVADLPLDEAYQFGSTRGIKDEVNYVRDMVINHGSSYSDWIRRACIIDLFEKNHIYEEFKRVYWPVGNTEEGKVLTGVYFEAKQSFDQANNYTTEQREKIKAEERDFIAAILSLFS